MDDSKNSKSTSSGSFAVVPMIFNSSSTLTSNGVRVGGTGIGITTANANVIPLTDENTPVDPINQKKKESVCENPCCCICVKLTSATRFSYFFGIFMDLTYLIMAAVFLHFNINDFKVIIGQQEIKPTSLFNDHTEPACSSEECVTSHNLTIVAMFTVIAFIGDCILICSVNIREHLIAKCSAYYWIVTCICSIVVEFTLIIFLGLSLDMFKPRSSLESYAKYRTYTSSSWFGGGARTEKILEQGYEKDALDAQSKHKLIQTIVFLLLGFGVLFIVIRIWCIFVIIAFKKKSAIQATNWRYRPGEKDRMNASGSYFQSPYGMVNTNPTHYIQSSAMNHLQPFAATAEVNPKFPYGNVPPSGNPFAVNGTNFNSFSPNQQFGTSNFQGNSS